MEFVCRVGTPDGRVVEEVRRAQDEVAARRDLERAGYRIFELRARGINLRLPRLHLGRGRLKLEDLLIFNQELASLLRAGLPLLQTLDLLIDRQRNAEFRTILEDVRRKVRSGSELSEAFRAQGDLFPPLYASTLTAGERSGELEQVIRRFVRYLKLVLQTRKRVVSALVYPTLLVFLSAAMITVMLVYVIPKFQVFYESLSVDLPWMTKLLLATSVFLQSNVFVIAALIAGAVVGIRAWRRTPSGRRHIDRIKVSLPLVGSILHRFSISEYCRSLSTLLAGGLPLITSLEVSTGAVGNIFLRTRLEPVVGRVREGAALHDALAETSIVPELTVDMVRVGEATGALDEMLGNASDFFDEEIETKIQRLLSLVEPLMLVFMGLIVSMLLVSMYLPLFSVLGKIQ